MIFQTCENLNLWPSGIKHARPLLIIITYQIQDLIFRHLKVNVSTLRCTSPIHFYFYTISPIYCLIIVAKKRYL